MHRVGVFQIFSIDLGEMTSQQGNKIWINSLLKSKWRKTLLLCP